MPPKRKLLILLNPFSGGGQAATSWEVARPILERAHVDIKLIRTQRAGHAYEIVSQELKPGDYNGIITVSGDGLIHEVVNGIYRR
jgi:sphingosine kinase